MLTLSIDSIGYGFKLSLDVVFRQAPKVVYSGIELVTFRLRFESHLAAGDLHATLCTLLNYRQLYFTT